MATKNNQWITTHLNLIGVIPDDVISVSDGELNQGSSLGLESSCACDSSASEGKESSDSEPAMSEVSDQYSMLEHAYQSVRNVF